MAQALKRIEKELKYFNGDDCEENYTAGPKDESDMYHWTGTFQGPENSPYEGGTFEVQIEFTKDYPFNPPKVEFVTKVYHPNVKKDTGTICLDILKDQWSPDIKLIDIFKAIQSLLVVPNIDHPLEQDIAKQYTENKEAFEANAKEWTEKYAQ